MILKIIIAKILVNIYPKLYRKYVVLEKGMKVLYVKLQNYIYGLLRRSLLVFLKLATDLKNNCFIINPYDPCVSNKLVKGEAVAVVCHVDDIKVLHKDPFEVTKFALYLSTVYRNKLKLHRVNIHDYLVIDLDYLEKGVVKVSMIKYPQKFLYEFP